MLVNEQCKKTLQQLMVEICASETANSLSVLCIAHLHEQLPRVDVVEFRTVCLHHSHWQSSSQIAEYGQREGAREINVSCPAQYIHTSGVA